MSQGEKPKVSRYNPREGIRQIGPVPSVEGVPAFLRERLVSVTRELRLFNKNTGDSKSERMCIVAESCPVTVSQTLFQQGEGPLNGGGNDDPLKVA